MDTPADDGAAEMRPSIPVTSYPMSRTFGSFEDAIEGARNHPLQWKAKADAAKLKGACVTDAYWTDAEHAIMFSNGLFLLIEAKPDVAWADDVTWQVTNAKPVLSGSGGGGIGSSAVVLDWGGDVGTGVMDRSALATKRLGGEVCDLFVNEMGLLLYCREQLIWWFLAIRRADLDRPMLYVFEED